MKSTIKIGLLGLLAAPFIQPHLHAGGVVATPDEASLRAALAGGGTVTFACDGTITLAATLAITNNTTLDASGRSITLSGANSVRIVSVDPGVSASLVNLTLAHGSVVGSNAVSPSQNGEPAYGAGILNNGGTVSLTACRFASNTVVGGNGYVGATPGSTGGAAGGAAVWNLGALFVTNCTFVANRATGGIGSISSYPPSASGEATGAGVGSLGGDVTIQNSAFDSNLATGGFHGQGPAGTAYGGALWMSGGTAVCLDSTFRQNTAAGGNFGNGSGSPGSSGNGLGGAIYLSGPVGTSLTLRGCGFESNRANPGYRARTSPGSDGVARGGALCSLGTATVVDCGFNGNQASGSPLGVSEEFITAGTAWGGALFNGGSLTLRSSALVGNSAAGGPGRRSSVSGGHGQGGAIESTGTLMATNCTLLSNAATGGNGGWWGIDTGGSAAGGGIRVSGGTAWLVNLTCCSNWVAGGLGSQAPDGVAVGGTLFTTNGSCGLLNTILANSPSGSNVFGLITDLGHNLSSDASCNFAGPGSLNNTDPVLGLLDDNGGLTLTMALLAGSPAIDGGDPVSYPPTDQRGRVRPFGAGPDIGAFESSPPYSIRGTVSGFTLTGEVSVNDGFSNVTTVNGRYTLAGLSANPYTVTPQSASYLFVPANRSVTVGPDQAGVDFKAYRWNMLSLDDVNGAVMHVVFAGTNGLNYRLLSSPNLVQWSTVSNYSMGPNQYWELFLPMSGGGPGFYRAVTP